MYELTYVSPEGQRAEVAYRHAAMTHDYRHLRPVRNRSMKRRLRAGGR